jgi:hypothetical protein
MLAVKKQRIALEKLLIQPQIAGKYLIATRYNDENV